MYSMKKTIGQIIKERRTELEWSQVQLAKRSGYSRLYIIKVETGQIKNPGIGAVKKIFDALSLKLGDI